MMKTFLPFVFSFLFCTINLHASLFYFDRITANSDINIESQLAVDVYAVGDAVAFKFLNYGPQASSISEVYFYDGSLLSAYSIDDSCPGVDFEDLGDLTDPAELPGYNPNASLLEVLSAAEAQRPESQNGIKPGQWMTITYTLQPNRTFSDVLTDLSAGQVVIGIHVKAIEQLGGGSTQGDSFISVPEPATMIILGLGGLLLRKRS